MFDIFKKRKVELTNKMAIDILKKLLFDEPYIGEVECEAIRLGIKSLEREVKKEDDLK